MEVHVGRFWHRLVTRAAQDRYPQAGVNLAQVATTAGILFRALRGDGGLQLEAATATAHGARRSWLQRLAGSSRKIELGWRDERSLRLPASIDLFPSTALNRDLYIWLAVMAAGEALPEEPWFSKNQRLTQVALRRIPGIRSRYKRLVAAHLVQRPDPASLPPDAARQEQAIRQALLHPTAGKPLPRASRPPYPVPLWLHPAPPTASGNAGSDDPMQNQTSSGRTQEVDDKPRRRQGERTEKPKENTGLLTIRMENIFSWGEFTKVDRGTDSDDDLKQGRDAAEDMDRMAVTRGGKASAGRLRFDLDLPAEENDDLILGQGIRLPEWDYKKQRMQPDHCRLIPMLAADAPPCGLPPALKRIAGKLRAQFQQLAAGRIWHRGQPEGSEIDIDAYLRYASDRAAGNLAGADGLYRDLRAGARDLVCLLLADLSLSTDTYISNSQRVVDVIRDSLFLFAETLSATGDRFSIYGFSSRRRDPIRVHQIKTFDQRYDADVRGRIAAIKPGYYTRMGAAVRYATSLLQQQPAGRRLLLLLTDGKPNDLDRYEGRYGIEDTRHAIQEARRQGLQPFCVTIDQKGNDYLPHLFGSGGYVVIRRPKELPRRLPLLYARLTH